MLNVKAYNKTYNIIIHIILKKKEKNTPKKHQTKTSHKEYEVHWNAVYANVQFYMNFLCSLLQMVTFGFYKRLFC